MKELINKFEHLIGAKFISLKHYHNSKGEIADHVINVNVDYYRVIIDDFKKLMDFKPNYYCNELKDFSKQAILSAFNELLTSYRTRLSKTRDNRSKGQDNAYTELSHGLRLHTKTNTLHIFGFEISKHVIKEGKKEKRNSKENTIIKDIICELAGLQSTKIKNFKVSNVSDIRIQGTNIHIHK